MPAGPTVTSGMRTIFDGSYTQKENISEFIDAIDPRDIPFLAMLGWNNTGAVSSGADSLAFPCFNTTHTWQNDQLIPSEGTLGAGYTSGGGTLTVSTGEGSYIKIADQLKVGNVYYEVTGVSSDSISVVVLDGSSDASHDNGTAWMNLGTLRLDGAGWRDTYQSTSLSTTSNYTQIFHEEVAVSGTSESIEKYGITNEFEREFAKKFQEMMIRLEKAAIYGLANSLPANNSDITTVRRMGGLANFIRYNSNAIRLDASGARLTEKMLVDRLEAVYRAGGKPTMIMASPLQVRIMDSWATPYVRTQRSEDTVGVITNSYMSRFGELEIVMNRHMLDTDVVILTPEYVGIGPLAGNGNSRAFFTTPIPVDGDRRKAAVTGEYTMEVRNADRAHAWIYGLSTDLS